MNFWVSVCKLTESGDPEELEAGCASSKGTVSGERWGRAGSGRAGLHRRELVGTRAEQFTKTRTNKAHPSWKGPAVDTGPALVWRLEVR